MPFAHDTVGALRAAVDLVNSGEEPDTLTTVSQVDSWYAAHGYTGRRDGDEAELAALRALRPILRDLLTADRDRAAELVNAMLADAGALPRLVRHDGLDWHIHAVPADAPLDRRVVVESAMAMIDVGWSAGAVVLARLAIAVSTTTRRSSGASAETAWMCQSSPSWRTSCGRASASASIALTSSAARSRSAVSSWRRTGRRARSAASSASSPSRLPV